MLTSEGGILKIQCDVDAVHFYDFIASFHLKQLLTMHIHTSGLTLDFIITGNQCNLMDDVMFHDLLISYHCAIFMHSLLHINTISKKDYSPQEVAFD